MSTYNIIKLLMLSSQGIEFHKFFAQLIVAAYGFRGVYFFKAFLQNVFR